MNLHEYQAKRVLAGFGVPVPRGVPVLAPDEIEAAVDELGGPVWVVKAQIHAGGRGKAGGVKVCASRADAVAAGPRHVRQGPGHPPDRPRRPRGAARLSGRKGPPSPASTISAPWSTARAGASR